MKRTLQFLFILISFFSLSQNYKPLLQEGNKWYEHKEDYNWDLPSPQYYTYIFINGEETKNGILYKKLFSNMYCYSSDRYFPCTLTGNADQFYKLLRENISEKKVYYYDEVSNSDILLYDFSLNKGDIHPNNFPFSDVNSFITDFTIDNINHGVVFDRNIKAFRIDDSHIYEGIGSNTGLLHKPGRTIFEGGNWLTCFEEANSGKSCNSIFTLGISEKNKESGFRVVYSRETKNLIIIGSSQKNYTIKFFDSSGKMIEHLLVKGNQNFKLKNSVKDQVVYYIILDGNNFENGKIIF